jgi:hypothetical protein
MKVGSLDWFEVFNLEVWWILSAWSYLVAYDLLIKECTHVSMILRQSCSVSVSVSLSVSVSFTKFVIDYISTSTTSFVNLNMD